MPPRTDCGPLGLLDDAQIAAIHAVMGTTQFPSLVEQHRAHQAYRSKVGTKKIARRKKKTTMKTIREQVTEFHVAFGQAIGDKPAVPTINGYMDATTVRLRARLVTEECIEMLEAIFGKSAPGIAKLREQAAKVIDEDPISVNLPELADAWADLDYVVEGSRLAFGVKGEPIAVEVHRSNMAKLGPDGKPIVRPDGKRMKPEGWTPPDIVGELKKQGWEGP